MPKEEKPNQGSCNPACTKIVKFMTDQKVPAKNGITSTPYIDINGYRYVNVYVRFTQTYPTDPPVNLGVIFAFDRKGTMNARRYVNFDENLSSPQVTNFIDVTCKDCSHTNTIGSYIARFPVMGPFMFVAAENYRASFERTVSIWGYLVS